VGAETLQAAASQYGLGGAFLTMGLDIIRHHHERFDGRGYPDRLSGDAIPLSARIVHIADVYDALRSRRPYKPPLSHATAVEIMLGQCEGQFDPFLLEAFGKSSDEFERIFKK
jgi:response regulator RpfG family c-di-GMP phosphodiesterase